jgi:hypothetical protein
MFAARSPNFHLTTAERAFAKNAKPFVIERIPVAELIFTAQDRQSIFG